MTNEDEYNQFRDGAIKITTKPEPRLAKRIVKVRCLNPTAKICYHYERIHEMTFEDGTIFVRREDHWRRPGKEMKEGNYVVLAAPGLTECYLTPDRLAAGYDIPTFQ